MLKDMREVYEPDDNWGWSDYDLMLKSFGEVICQGDFGSYQGDTLAILFDDGKYGYILFGWGSCSGCDALQACYGDMDKLNDLAKRMWDSIVWYDTPQELIDWLKSHDYEGDYLEYYGDELHDFLHKAISILESRV